MLIMLGLDFSGNPVLSHVKRPLMLTHFFPVGDEKVCMIDKCQAVLVEHLMLKHSFTLNNDNKRSPWQYDSL